MPDLVPPTVPVPLGELAGDDPPLGLRHAAGPAAPEAPVYSVQTSEMADPRPYLLGGELLLSAGVHFAETEGPAADAYWDGYAAAVAEARATALGFGVDPVHARVPPALSAACDRLGLPLYEVPPRTPFAAVARAVWQLMGERRHRELRRLSEAQHTLAAAAARPHPVRAVLRQLAQHLDAFTALYGPGGAELACAGTPRSTVTRTELSALTCQLRPGPSSAASSYRHPDGEEQLSAYGLGGRERLALGVSVRRGADGGADGGGGAAGGARESSTAAIASVAVVLLALLTEPRAAATDARRSAALLRLMLGAPAHEAAPLLGEEGAGWTVVHGRRQRGGSQDGGGGGEAQDPFELSELAAGLGTQYLDVQGDRLRALVPSDEPVAARPGWLLGASAPVEADALGEADAQAARALRRAVAERRSVVQQGGAARGVADLVPAEERRAHARALLAPLDARPELTETLHMWLSLHGSWDRTAVALSVHRNTVRQRITKAGALLGLDLAGQDARMELWFALTWR
ncbi:helix-turn-helix domain-containing protein [Streptomyces sp. ODS28]|uniref:helix-turn-helix domain-containing protein n=1 Tax=Streptomyces sp. ODS28 TaxID=3136688 RepID=UPI0031EFAE61